MQPVTSLDYAIPNTDFLKQSDMAHIQVRVWRRMLQVSYKEGKTNEWIRQKVGVLKSKDCYSATEEDKTLYVRSLEKRRPGSRVQITIGEVEGKARPGRRKTGWIDNINSWTYGGMEKAGERE